MIRKILKRLRGEPNIDKLKKQGMEVGDNFWFGSNCIFDPAHCFLISIGNNVTFSSHVHVLTHDASPQKIIGYTKIGRVKICDDVFVGANTTILPGVVIGKGAIVGAGSVVTKDCEADYVYAGVPAKKICSVNEYIERVDAIGEDLRFGETHTVRDSMNDAKKEEMKSVLENNKYGLVR